MEKRNNKLIDENINNTKTQIEQTTSITYKETNNNLSRIDLFLTKTFPDCSRSYFQKLILTKFITVNSKFINKNYNLKNNDKIIVSFPKEQPIDLSPQKIDFEIIDTQKDFIVVNKPINLIVHNTKENKNNISLVNGLLYKFKELKKFNNSERPGIVHRLDKNTSGLLLIARNLKTHAKLSDLFKQRLIKKTYLAVVKGHPPLKGKIDLPIGRHPVQRNKMSHASYRGRPALTYYKVLKYYKNCALISVNIITGRTHQIRVHFAALGHGLLGDSVYGINSKLINRPALHSWKIEFEFQNKKFNYHCHIPKDFLTLLQTIKEN